MALTRRFLSALGIDAEKIDEIINAHVETVDALKEERDKFKTEAEKVGELEKENKTLKESNKEDFEAKYNELSKEYEAYKKDVSEKELNATKSQAYRKLLGEAGVSEKRIDAIMKVTSLSDLELTKEGTFKNAEELSNSIKTEWSDFIETKKKIGAETAKPPANEGSTFESMTLADKMVYANEHPNAPEVTAWLKK